MNATRSFAAFVFAPFLLVTLPAQDKVPSHPFGEHVGPQAPSGVARWIDWELNAALSARHAGWQRWASENPGWVAIFDARTGKPDTAYGPGIPVVPVGAGEEQVSAAAETWLRRVLEATGDTDLAFERLSTLTNGPMWYAHFVQLHAGLRVLDARLTIRIDQAGRLVAWTARPVDTRRLDVSAAVDPSSARRIARDHLLAHGWIRPETNLAEISLDAVIHVETSKLGSTATPAWRWTAIADDPRADWIVFSDIKSGAVVAAWNDIRECGPGNPETLGALFGLAQINGVVQGTTHAGLLPHQAPQMTNFPDIRLTCAGVNVVTDSTGAYSFNGGGASVAVTCGLDGPWVSGTSSLSPIANFSGTATGGVFDVVFLDSISTIGERDMIYFANRAHANLKLRAPAITTLDSVMGGTANLTTTSCNASYSPLAHSMNFYAAAGNCINTATSSGVVIHEYGHGVTTRIYQAAGAQVAGYMGEGLSDCQSAAADDTNILGSGFQGPGTYVRNLDNTCQYPASCGSADIHIQGLVIGGCFWHTRVQFANAFGAAGKVQMDQYLYRHFVAAPVDEIDSALEMLLLDDNDANLVNGTPNLVKFYNGYAIQHGVPFPVELMQVSVSPLADSLDQLQAYQVRATASSAAGTVTGATLNWRSLPTASFTAVAMTSLGGGNYAGSIPVQPANRRVEYYVRVTDNAGTIGTSPSGAPSSTHSFATFRSTVFYSDSFEAATSPWTHAIIANGFTNQDDWQNAAPGNPSHAYDPPSAYHGTKVWGNDLSASGFNGVYANNVSNQLTSPAINCSGRSNVALVYRRWLTIEDGLYDQARILASNNGSTYTQLWQNVVGSGSQNHIDTSWVQHAVNISSVADNQAALRVRFQLTTDAGLTFGGWTIDDLRLTAQAGPVLTTSGSTSVGQVFNVHINGETGDQFLLAFDIAATPTLYAGLGTLSLDLLSPTFSLLIPFMTIPSGGQVTLPIVVPPAVGATGYFQSVLIPASQPTAPVISNVLVVTVTP